jgi:hypothetical protein
VRKLFGWMAGLAGIAALARLLAARHARLEAPARAPSLPPDPAVDLRRKLAEAREQPAAAAAEASTETLDERRARVHAKAHEAVDAMEALQEPPA